MESELQRIDVSLEEKLLTRFDSLIESKGYTNRSEAIRDLIRECLAEKEWRQDGGESFGTITLVYNHYLRETADRLSDLQQQYHQRIISVLHVRLDAHHCLAVLVVKGEKVDMRAIAVKLNSLKHYKLVELRLPGRNI
jgi:CopG family transcriptional regulator, nickel-responsive regulator